ncbi:hypothetical protein [Anabaena azotica]|uniref:hypothetical protein n=1 Tax=Anabaena azotica TaxID=197653 RepID=UPI0039A45C81
MNIQIYDLYSTHEPQLIHELTSSEMKNINGGISSRRSRNRNPNTTDRSELSALLADVNSSIANWRLELNETLDNLRVERLDV